MTYVGPWSHNPGTWILIGRYFTHPLRNEALGEKATWGHIHNTILSLVGTKLCVKHLSVTSNLARTVVWLGSQGTKGWYALCGTIIYAMLIKCHAQPNHSDYHICTVLKTFTKSWNEHINSLSVQQVGFLATGAIHTELIQAYCRYIIQ